MLAYLWLFLAWLFLVLVVVAFVMGAGEGDDR